MDHEFFHENFSSATVNTLPNTTIYFEGHEVFEYQTEKDLLSEP